MRIGAHRALRQDRDRLGIQLEGRMQQSSVHIAPATIANRVKQHTQHLQSTQAAETSQQNSMASKSLKILMLHGYTQNGTLFHIKTKVLEKSLLKVFPGTTFTYPTGPMRLKPSDIPGFDSSSFQGDEDESENYGWWRRSNTSEPPEYLGFEDGLGVIAKVLKDEGPFDGVMGFSQGAAAAAMVASLLEPGRRSAFETARQKSSLAIEYPASFAGLDHPPLKFFVNYCGFAAPGERYQSFYEPLITTPACHVLGTVDSVVEEDRARKLVSATGGTSQPTVIMHPGGHFVPSGKQYVEAVAGFIRSTTDGGDAEVKQEESVEDMDVPF